METKKLYIENYGCQMNLSDSEIVASVMKDAGYSVASSAEEADVVFLNTCSVRDKAEQTVMNRLAQLGALKKKKPGMLIAILGCMAERLKQNLLDEKMVDIVAGPDVYRKMPDLIATARNLGKAIDVRLNYKETYGNITPLRFTTNHISAFVTVMRGCDNMCTYCVVPYTRGRERSRDPQGILAEVKKLEVLGYKEITLLGQNIDSYLWYGGGPKKDFKKAPLQNQEKAIHFADLLRMVAEEVPDMRIRFITSNPRDISEQVLDVMASHPNICRYLHLPVQSGSNRILKRMRRGYTREQYMELIDKIRRILPDCAITMDMISGYPGETEQDHQDTLSLMDYVQYDFGFMFRYSQREGTYAAKYHPDDVPEEIKLRRLAEVIDKQSSHSMYRNKQWVGKVTEVLVDGFSKKHDDYLSGRNSQNTLVVFPKGKYAMGDFVKVKVVSCTQTTLIGEAVD